MKNLRSLLLMISAATALVTLLLLASTHTGWAADTVQRIYTAPDPKDQGGIKGSCAANISHALAMHHDRLRVYRGEVTGDGHSFSFAHLPVGKYDLVMVTTDKLVYEGLALGEAKAKLTAVSQANLQKRVETQDAFFNHAKIHRMGFDGPTCLLFVERTSDRKILRQSGEALGADLRRLEVMEIAQAADDWQVTTTRHLYREEQPVQGIDFIQDKYVPEFSNLRVIDSVKDLGTVVLPPL